jgi:hypothetical protein
VQGRCERRSRCNRLALCQWSFEEMQDSGNVLTRRAPDEDDMVGRWVCKTSVIYLGGGGEYSGSTVCLVWLTFLMVPFMLVTASQSYMFHFTSTLEVTLCFTAPSHPANHKTFPPISLITIFCPLVSLVSRILMSLRPFRSLN